MNTRLRSILFVLLAILLGGLIVFSRRSHKEPETTQAGPDTSTVQVPAPKPPVPSTNEEATRLESRHAALLAKIKGMRDYNALDSNQVHQYQTVVAPAVSNFISILQKAGVSRFDNQSIGPANFLKLATPRTGFLWDLKLHGNNDRDYFVGFAQTREMGFIAGFTNVNCFFPMKGPSIQGIMDGILPEIRLPEVQPRADAVDDTIKDLSRQILVALGNDPRSFIEMSSSTEKASGIPGGYIAYYRPKDVDSPDNVLYDTMFGYFFENGKFVLDTFTYGEGLLPPARQKGVKPKPAVPQF